MRVSPTLVLFLLILVSFTAGLGARHYVTGLETAAAARANEEVLTLPPMTQVASLDLHGAGDVDFRPVETLYSVVKSVRENYVEQITPQDEGEMTYQALRAMLASFEDPNTRFLEPEQRKLLGDARSGVFHGIGAVLAIRPVTSNGVTDEHLVVVTTLPGGPAEQAGLQPGDDIIEIDGRSVLPFDPYKKVEQIMEDARNRRKDKQVLQKELEVEHERIENGITAAEAQDLLFGGDRSAHDEHLNKMKSGSSAASKKDAETEQAAPRTGFQLTVVRADSTKSEKLAVATRDFSVDPVTSSIDTASKNGYIRINCLCRTTPERFDAAMKDMMSSDARGLVLDLRGVAGGDVAWAAEIARWFAPGKTLAIARKSRGRKVAVEIPPLSDAKPWKKPLVVIVDRGTARTGEVLAAALRENAGARLVGQRTFGDFTQTAVVDQIDGSAVSLTTGKYLTSKGGIYDMVGLPVTVEVDSKDHPDRPAAEAAKLLDKIRNGKQK